MSSRPVHFEIHVDDPARAAKFYSELFGWQFTLWSGQEYWVIKTGPDTEPGIDGGLVKRKGEQSGNKVSAYVCSMAVPSVDAAVEKAIELGGKNVVPKMPIPGVGWLAYCTDTEDNIFGVTENDPSAK